MKMLNNWDELRYILALGKAGSMIEAAKSLNTNSTTVSRKIQAASERYDQPLFLKKYHGWEMTDAGRKLFDLASSLERELGAVLSGLEDENEARPILVTSLDFLNRTVMFPRLSALHADHPNIQMTLHSSNENLSLAYGEADIAVRLARPTSGRLIGRKLCDLEYSIFCPRGGDCINWIGREEDLEWIPEIKMACDHFKAKPVLRVTSYKATIDAMKRMNMASVLPNILTDDHPEMLRVPGSPTVTREVWLVIHESRKTDPAVRSVMGWLTECFKEYCMRQRQLVA